MNKFRTRIERLEGRREIKKREWKTATIYLNKNETEEQAFERTGIKSSEYDRVFLVEFVSPGDI
jgi:hypothetical protein